MKAQIITISFFIALSLACKSMPSDSTAQTSTESEPEPQTIPQSQKATPVPDEVGSSAPQAPADDIWKPGPDSLVFVDRETGSKWNARGQAFEGELEGKRLSQHPSFNAFWFAWSAFYHGGTIWGRDTVNTPGEITGSSECGVPCDEIVMGCPSKDCIPALDHQENAKFVPADSPGADYLDDSDFVLGTFVEGRPRAYPHNILWWHEIVNDRAGDTEYTVTFCPLTGSGLVFAGTHRGESVDYGVSGRLYNSNLVMYDRQTDSFFSQMLREGIKGPKRGQTLELLPVTETTWGQWKRMHPQTRVVSVDTGYRRNYERYPYGDYRTNDTNTFRPSNPDFEKYYDAKDRVLVVVGDEGSRAYPFKELFEVGSQAVVNDEFEDESVVILWDGESRLAVPFVARVGERDLTFDLAD